jgi:inhibitor of KinA sporulation pathway (predicted exonuclease)
MNRIALDLEYYATEEKADPTRIIQVGYCIFNVITGEVVYTGGDYVQIDIPLSNFITILTGITQKDVDHKGVDIITAVDNMIAKCEEYNVGFHQFVTWGSGDGADLRNAYLKAKGLQDNPPHQLFDTGWKFGTAELNTKVVYQAMQIQKGNKYRGGLKKSLMSVGVPWDLFVESDTKRQRSAHDARCDALNTANMYMYLFKWGQNND